MCIFTQQLYALLQDRNKNLDSLYAVIVPGSLNPKQPLAPEKIKRMKKIVEEQDYSKSTTLNPAEIEAVRAKFRLTARELDRLRSALAGEFVFRYLFDRTGEIERALRAGNYVFDLLFQVKPENVLVARKQLLAELRPADETEEQSLDLSQKMEADLAPTIELYEKALLCLEAAQTTNNPFIREGYRAMAHSLLTNAYELITYPSELVDGSPEQTTWQELITLALVEADE